MAWSPQARAAAAAARKDRATKYGPASTRAELRRPRGGRTLKRNNNLERSVGVQWGAASHDQLLAKHNAGAAKAHATKPPPVGLTAKPAHASAISRPQKPMATPSAAPARQPGAPIGEVGPSARMAGHASYGSPNRLSSNDYLQKHVNNLRGAQAGVPTPGYTRKRGRGAL
jgi:hypothetical protein